LNKTLVPTSVEDYEAAQRKIDLDQIKEAKEVADNKRAESRRTIPPLSSKT
jgi:hypothetical protein